MRNDGGRQRFRVTAGLVRKNGKLLVSKRRKGSHLEGFWEFPGGKQERGESLSECLERELREELGISVMVGPGVTPVLHDYALVRVVLYGFCCTWLKGEPEALECQEFRWVALSELMDLKLPPPDIKIIKKLFNSKIFQEWMKGKDMFYKKNSEGYSSPVKGVRLKSLTNGEKTHMCEFMIDGGSEIPEHSHPHEQTGYLVSGKLTLITEDQRFDAEPGDSWSIPENVPHSATAINDSVIVEVFSPVRKEYL
ncbi:MAG: NUDIX domain-containing protein [Deltaproteobacteria bacterium]|nr:NUDIX domain-containing protein [Deltaproteobacteria bacterium]